MINPVLPISSEEISYKGYDLIFLYDTKNLFFALLTGGEYNYEATNKLLDKFDNYDIQPEDYQEVQNTILLDFIIDIFKM